MIRLLFQIIVEIGTFAASLATIAAAVFVGYQALIARKDFQERNKRAAVEKTSDLIRFYIDEVLPYASYIDNVIEQIGIKPIRDSIETRDMVDFSTTEMLKLLKPDEIATYSILFSGRIKSESLLQARYALRHVEATQNFWKQVFKMFPSFTPKKVDEYEVNFEFVQIANSVMSNLEYFCMCFNEGIASDDLAYSSIHQTFLPLVKTFYVRISQLNTDSSKQYYSQIRKMYVRWVKMH